MCEAVKTYARNHIKVPCVGNTEIPPLLKNVVVEDDWASQLACVLLGQKRLAMIDYDGRRSYDTRQYYGFMGFDRVILEDAEKKCPELRHLVLEDATRIYYLRPNEAYAKLMRKVMEGYYDEPIGVRSLLLGYNPAGTIAYETAYKAGYEASVYRAYLKDPNWMKKISSRIETAQKWIEENL